MSRCCRHIASAFHREAFSIFADPVLLKRIGTPEDIANLVSFIASKESQFITGQSISINGGLFFD
ncbi:hypothetical protein B0H16DRAFT_806692 [Mycena metata]|uniref:Uncharacterized protein n=1 Tax=Mycena metata TaxID=1033252 RepID=A0AAD7K8A5_9AGAR|nr:hypothetical protein B0H16DRAFT_806692 [Mycena metata]